LTLFEAQDASDIVSAAATSDVNIIFGTSINEELGDEVIVTVIATGIDTARINDSQKNRGRANQTSSRPAGNNNVNRQETTSDPFGNWDIRRETSVQENVKEETEQREEQELEKPEFDLFGRTNKRGTQSTEEDAGLEMPPFFRRRRNSTKN